MDHLPTRRDFLRRSAAAGAGLFCLPTMIPSSVRTGSKKVLPNDRINLGFIGVGNMGTGHLRSCTGYDDVMVTAVCDVRKEHRDRAKEIVDTAYGNTDCAAYNDFRELLARGDIDAVLTATPDHWHALIGIEAARRGKHMYYEKPASLTIDEAKALRGAVNSSGVVFQFGTQQRSDERFRRAVELVRNGRIGQLEAIVVGSSTGGDKIIPLQPIEPVPEGFDYDFWLGPAPWAPFTSFRCTRNWTHIADYSLGSLSGAWGIHNVDIAQWAADADHTGPVEVRGTGTIPADGLFDTYGTWYAEHRYDSGVKLVHADWLSARERFPEYYHPESTSPMGILFRGPEGWIYVARGFIDASPKAILHNPVSPGGIRLPVSNDHRRNFFDAVRTGRQTICPVENAVRSETVCQQAFIAMELEQTLYWDPVRERFKDNETANTLLSRPMRSPWHL